MDYDICDMRFINLNSSNATKNNGSFLSDVKFDFKNILSDDLDIKYVTCGILNAQIPVSFYTLNYTNYLLNFSVDGGIETPLIIQEGNYNSNSLILEIINEFSLLGHFFEITTSRITGVMNFKCTGHSFTFYGDSTIFKILGFSEGTNYNSISGEINAIYPLNLLGIKRINVNSSSLSTNVFDSNSYGLTSIIASIPVDMPSFALINYINASNAFPILRSKNISYVDIQIYDEESNLINFNGVNWTITIQMNIYRKGIKVNNDIDFSKMVNLLEDIKYELIDDNSKNNENNDNINDNNNDNTNQIYENYDEDLDTLLYNGNI